MIIEQIYTSCLAEAAYYIESKGEAAVIDPLRDPQPYIEMAKANGAQIKYVFETHFHADFVSGHVDLAEKTGADIVFGPGAEPAYPCHIASNNEEFRVGDLVIRALHTPGHTLESTTYLLIDEYGKEYALFTGDTLFLGDVGRPDLAIKSDLTMEDLAGMLYDSLRSRIMGFGDDILIYPAHGAGSACGKNMSSETVGTLGEQRHSNFALQADLAREDFIRELTSGILPPPQYFPKNAMLNKLGYKAFSEVKELGLRPLSMQAFNEEVSQGSLILDVRHQDDFISGHIPGSQFIGLNGTFAVWVGALISDLHQSIVLIAPEGQEEEAVTRLARVGYDHVKGFLVGGVATYVKEGGRLNSVMQVDSTELSRLYSEVSIVDVRRPNEFQTEHVVDALSFPLDFIAENTSLLNPEETHYIHCAGGYRSVIAISYLMREGYTRLVDVAGGFGALVDSELPKSAYLCPSAARA